MSIFFPGHFFLLRVTVSIFIFPDLPHNHHCLPSSLSFFQCPDITLSNLSWILYVLIDSIYYFSFDFVIFFYFHVVNIWCFSVNPNLYRVDYAILWRQLEIKTRLFITGCPSIVTSIWHLKRPYDYFYSNDKNSFFFLVKRTFFFNKY